MTFNRILKYIFLLSPIPEGYAVGLAIQKELGWTPLVVWISAVVIASTGFWGILVFNRMSEFNASLFGDERKLKYSAPTWKAGAVLGIWFAGVVGLTVFLKTSPVLRDWAPPAIVVIGACGAYLFSLSNEQESREQEKSRYRVTKANEKEDARKARKAERKIEQQRAQELETIRQKIRASTQEGEGIRRGKTGSKLSDEMLLLEWAIDPYLTNTEMARVLMKKGIVAHVTRQAVGQRRDTMIRKGLIVQNPDGRVVEYLEVGQGSGDA